MSNKKETEINTEDKVFAEDLQSSEQTVNNANGEPSDTAEMDKLSADLQEQKEKYIRLFAEFDNFKKRNAREKIELMQTAGKDIIVSLLDVLDDCDRAETQMQEGEDINQLREGVILVFNKFRSILESKGVKSMQSLNTDFDAEKHEAVAEIETGKDKIGKVVDEVTKGYYLNDKIIRFAKVVVGK